MKKLKSPLIILMLILLTFAFLILPEYLFERSNLRILKTKENLTYNYTGETISPSNLAELFCKGQLETSFSSVFKDFENKTFSEDAIREKTDFLLKNLFKGAHSSLYPLLSDITSGEITDYGENKVFISSSLEKPIALNFVSIAFKKDHTHFALFFEEKTQTVFFMEYIPNISLSENYKEALTIAWQLNDFFHYYFPNVLKTYSYNVDTYTYKSSVINCINTLEQENTTQDY